MRIAILIVTWNAAPTLERTLNAVSAQQRRADRTIVIDNASADTSVAVARRFSSVEIIALTRNAGFAEGNNVGAQAAADCDWIALLNPDAFPDPDWLARLEDAARTSPGVVMFASELRNADRPELLDGAGDAYHVSGLAWRIGHGSPALAESGAVREVFGPCGAAALLERAAFLEVGGFDPRFFCYFEDVDLACRLRLRGHRCLYVPGARVLHIGSASTTPGSAFAIYHGHRNLVWAWVKTMPGLWLWIYLPQHLLLTIASLLRFGLTGQAATLLRAKRDAIAGLPEAWRARRQLQRERTVSASTIRQQMSRGWLTPYLAHARRGVRPKTP